MSPKPQLLSPAGLPLQRVVFKKSDFEAEDLSLFNTQWTNLLQAVTQLSGRSGRARILSSLSLNGNPLTDLADPVNPTDGVSKGYADKNYGPAAIQSMIGSLGDQIMQGARRVNDTGQRESYSSFLNALMSTAPSTNTSIVTFTPGIGVTTITVSSGIFQQLDGTQIPYATINDVVSNPASTAVYYYYLPLGSSTLARIGPVTQDSWAARLAASYDGNQIIAIASLNSSGGISGQSGAGATPLAGAPIISRL
jgi:hypothetical protein